MKAKSPKKSTSSTHIAFILDRSGSMSTIAKEIIGGFNNFIEEQKAVPGACTVTLVQFDDQIDRLETFKPLAEIKPLTAQTYIPRGMTKLYDAIGLTCKTTKEDISKAKEAPSKVLVIILTDGLENSSQEYTTDSVKRLLEARQADGWQFTFIGANQDAILTARGIGLSNAASNITFSASPEGAKRLFPSISAQCVSFREAPIGTGYSYSQADRDAQSGSPASFSKSTSSAVFSENSIKAGRKGGPARAEAMTAKERSSVARAGAEARWSKKSV